MSSPLYIACPLPSMYCVKNSFCLKPVFYDQIQEVQKVIWKIVIFLIEWGCQLKISWSNSSIFRWGNIKRRHIWNIWVFIVFKLNPVWTGWHPETDEAGSSYLLLIQLRIKSYTYIIKSDAFIWEVQIKRKFRFTQPFCFFIFQSIVDRKATNRGTFVCASTIIRCAWFENLRCWKNWFSSDAAAAR